LHRGAGRFVSFVNCVYHYDDCTLSTTAAVGTRIPTFNDQSPDLPLLFEGSPKVGPGLYDSVAAILVTDIGLLVGGIVVYLVSTRAKDCTGTSAFWLTVLFIVMLALPAAVPGLSILATLALVLLLPLGNWVDQHRSLAAASVPRVS
jgi:hypothetical protein